MSVPGGVAEHIVGIQRKMVIMELPFTFHVISPRGLIPIVACLVLGVLQSVGQAQTSYLKPSPLPGSETTQVSTVGSTHSITGGALRSNNLFHSFAEFGVPQNETAAFLNPNVLQIIARVTGPSAQTPPQVSQIFGKVSTLSGAALWLINPSGIIVGPNAAFSVGSLHLSTADYLRMKDGAKFYASLNSNKQSTLSSEPVTAFGFLGERPAGPITVQAGSPLAVSEGKAISLIGGDIGITGRTVSASGGQINIASVSGAGEVVPNQVGQAPSLDLMNVSKQGTVQLTEGTIIKTSSTTNDAGAILIRSGHFIMANAAIEATATGNSRSGGQVNIQSEEVDLKGRTDAATFAAQSSTADRMKAGGFSAPSGVTIWTNNKGDITLAASTLHMDNVNIMTEGQLRPWFDFNNNETGYLHIQGMQGPDSLARVVSIRNGSVLGTVGYNVETFGRVLARDLSIRASNIELANSTIFTDQGHIRLFGENQIRSFGNSTIQKQADYRDLDKSETDIDISSYGTIAFNTGDKISSLLIPHTDPSSFSSQAGDIVLRAPNITMNGTTVEANGRLYTTGGNITFQAGYLEVVDSRISTNALGSIALGGGVAGSITMTGMQKGVKAEGIRLVNSTVESLVPSGPSALGTSGTITLEGNNVLVDGSTISITHGGAGQSGSIMVNGGNLTLTNGSHIRADSIMADPIMAPNAGEIHLTSGDNISITNSTVSTSATQASGGNIRLTAPNMVRLVGANLTSSVFGPARSNGGNISIDTVGPQFVIMQGSSQILAQAIKGRGGDITIHGGVVLQELGSVISATSMLGISGSIDIQAPIQQLAGAIAPLPQAFAVATNLYGQRCAAEKGGQFSSFVQGARDGVPPQPGDLIPSPLLLELDEAPFSTGSQSTSSLAAIRLGLPEFELVPPISRIAFTGCRS